MSEPETVTLSSIDAQRADVLRLAFLRQHPRLTVADVTIAREADVWIITTEGAHFRALLTATRAVFVNVDPRDHAIDLAPPEEVMLPAPPEPPPMPSTGLDVAAEIRRARTVLDAVRRFAERARVALRAVAETESEEVERLRNAAPLGAYNVEGLPLSPEAPLLRLAQEAAEARAVVRDLSAALVDARALAAEVSPRIKAAIVDLETAKHGESLRDLGRLDNLGAIAATQLSAHEERLDVLGDVLDAITRAVSEAGPLSVRFDVVARIHARSCLVVAREVGVAVRSARLAQIRAVLDRDRLPTRAEALALEACDGLSVADLPAIAWSSDPLAAPVLEKKDGGK